MKRSECFPIWLLFCLLVSSDILTADEGMFPISELQKLDLRSQGLRIDPEELYGTDRANLLYAIVSVGATGSFVSPQGLFVTNHHVAFGAVQAASTPERDHLKNGFLAHTGKEEIQARGMTARITESFHDVSREVLDAVREEKDLTERTRAVERKIKNLVADAEKKNPGKRAEVSEMFLGRTYVLFLYTYLRDIRLVYVPPRAIGEFGGETDNWMWPRHTGDFSFLRAYVSPDGSPADYHPANVPFRPKRFLKVDPRGVQENDFVFLLGYPGRTYRHMPADYLAYEQDVRLPLIADWYAWQIAQMEKAGEGDNRIALTLASRVKSLANTMKNYRGKLKGMKKLELVAKKREEEARMQKFIEADPQLRQDYGDVLAQMKPVYQEMRDHAETDLWLEQLRSSVQLFQFAWTAYEHSLEKEKPDLERESAYMDRNWSQTRQRLQLAFQRYHAPLDQAVFREIVLRLLRAGAANRVRMLEEFQRARVPETAIAEYVAGCYAASRIGDEKMWSRLLQETAEEIRAEKDPFLSLAVSLYPVYQEMKERAKKHKGTLDVSFQRLGSIREKFLGRNFIPDANGTLRMTYGRVRGYEPADAVSYRPFTTLRGLLEKTTGLEPFQSPEGLGRLFRAKDFGSFLHPDLNDIPVCMLYDTDTTGGNSGSPVLNADGNLVGINFDRTYEATINDYAWSREYSRSIAVDIRYVMWIVQKFTGTDSLLKEMGI